MKTERMKRSTSKSIGFGKHKTMIEHEDEIKIIPKWGFFVTLMDISLICYQTFFFLELAFPINCIDLIVFEILYLCEYFFLFLHFYSLYQREKT
jgi:hypothetical protein